MSTVATILRAVKQEVAQEVKQVVKQEADGGWPTEFQELRQQPFDQAGLVPQQRVPTKAEPRPDHNPSGSRQ